jgi:hypothetical protein
MRPAGLEPATPGLEGPPSWDARKSPEFADLESPNGCNKAIMLSRSAWPRLTGFRVTFAAFLPNPGGGR